MPLQRFVLKKIFFFLFLGAVFEFSIFNTQAALIQFQDDFFEEISSDSLLIDADDNALGDIQIQFGNDGTLIENGVIEWNVTDNAFIFTNEAGGAERANLSFEIEPVSALPGGGAGLGAAGEGRIVILDTADSVAPGCTVVPNCSAGTYIWDGAAWVSLVGSPTSTNLTKVVTVDPGGGADYTDIETAAAYLQTRSGGIMLLSADTHTVSTEIDLTNVIMIGKDSTRTTVQISGAGQFDGFDTTLEFLTIDVNAITDNYAVDIQDGSSSIIFNFVDFDIQDSGDSLIDSSAVTAPTVTMKFIKSNAVGAGSGVILKTVGAGNLNGASSIFVDSRSSDNPLEMSDWDLILAGGGSVNTTGIITPIPADNIIVSDQMNLQGAIDSLESVGNGGTITLLPGTHIISQTLTIQDDNIRIEGFGDATVIETSGTFASTGSTIGALQVGTLGSPVDGVVLSSFRLEVNDNIHGIRVTGGADHRIDNLTVVKVTGTSGSGDATADIGILMIDGTAEDLVRPVIVNSRVFGSGGVIYFTDGIHVTSDGTFGGVFGNGNRVRTALVDGNFVDYVGETAYVFVGVDDSSLFNNRASRMGAGGGGAFGIYMGNATNINMTANVFSTSLSTAGIAIGVESFNAGSLKTTRDSIFSGNIIDGLANGGVGFATGFQVGNAANTDVLRNSFQNNTVAGAIPGVSVAFVVRGNADDNTISTNSFRGGTNPWDTGINLQAATQERNLLRNNVFSNVTTRITDVGTSTQFGVSQHRATVNPSVGDDINDGFEVGTIWVNTSSDSAFILQDSTVGAAVWDQIDGGASALTLDQAYNNGNTVTIDAAGGNLTFDLTQFSDFVIQDNGVTFATFADDGDFDLLNNLTVGADTETIGSDGGFFALDGDDVFIAGSLGVESGIATDDTQTKYLEVDIEGCKRGGVSRGNKISGNVPILRMDPDTDSQLRCTFPVPDDYQSGDITVTLFWSPSNTNTGNVQWEVTSGAAGVGDTLAGGLFTTVTPTEAANGTTNEIQTESFDITGVASDDFASIRILRDADNVTDTYTGFVDISSMRIEYTGKKLR